MSQVEKAKIPDAIKIHKLINRFADKGQMLPRPLSEIYESIRDFYVISEGEEILACAALHVSWADLAEIRSVAVAEDSQKKGMGAKLVAACLKEAEELGIKTIFCFTYKPEFFKRYKFVDVDKMELPRKVWTDCFRCPKFPNCDETSLIYHA
ncbi:MAG: GNAT family N-acetyltransferase [Chloroflexi bacterium RBG_13_52_12]|nr:MAG: GNAT family N-acetyltransferase [Chloroflexi bacterium RBG_13_52_12]